MPFTDGPDLKLCISEITWVIVVALRLSGLRVGLLAVSAVPPSM